MVTLHVCRDGWSNHSDAQSFMINNASTLTPSSQSNSHTSLVTHSCNVFSRPHLTPLGISAGNVGKASALEVMTNNANNASGTCTRGDFIARTDDTSSELKVMKVKAESNPWSRFYSDSWGDKLRVQCEGTNIWFFFWLNKPRCTQFIECGTLGIIEHVQVFRSGFNVIVFACRCIIKRRTASEVIEKVVVHSVQCGMVP
jgi:hypothetical protein